MKDQVCLRFLVVLFCTMGLGCSFLGKSDALLPRFYTPESTTPRPAGSAKSKSTDVPELRVGRVTSASDLKDNMAFRDGKHEVGYYDERLWTERPEAYLSRALGWALFEGGSLAHVVSGPAPTLDVRLLAFEEIRGTPSRVRIRIAVLLHDERLARLDETLTFEQVIVSQGKPSGEDVARALGETLTLAVQEIARRVDVTLRAAPRPPGG